MIRRKPYRPAKPPWPDHWAVTTDCTIRGQRPRPGVTELKIRGERGRFVFLRHVTNTATGATWLDVLGGTDLGTDREVIMLRSFRPDRVTRVLRSRKMHP